MFISKVFITALISHQAISQTFETEAFNPGSLCGNGRLDAGEECDPLIVGSEECCTAECRNMAGSTVCAGGLGVCGGSTANGKCSTRKAQCNTLQSSALQFPSTPQTTITVHAPWDVCTVPKTAPSKIGSILPPFFQRQSTCSLACEGIQDNNQPFCIDFTKFTGVPSSLPDYMPCITDATANIDLNSITPANLPNAIPPGICMAGQCRPDLCSQQKCGGRGQCVLNQNVYLFAKQNINNAQFNAYVATPNNFSSTDAAALVQCRCNAGFSGANCQIVGNGGIFHYSICLL